MFLRENGQSNLLFLPVSESLESNFIKLLIFYNETKLALFLLFAHEGAFDVICSTL